MDRKRKILVDEDNERRTQAEVLLNAYSRELERQRLAAGAQGLLLSGDCKLSFLMKYFHSLNRIIS